jgi:hypothetical protein
MIKYGVLTEDSKGDFNLNKKAEYYDAQGLGVADADNKDKLKAPVLIADTKESK